MSGKLSKVYPHTKRDSLVSGKLAPKPSMIRFFQDRLNVSEISAFFIALFVKVFMTIGVLTAAFFIVNIQAKLSYSDLRLPALSLSGWGQIAQMILFFDVSFTLILIFYFIFTLLHFFLESIQDESNERIINFYARIKPYIASAISWTSIFVVAYSLFRSDFEANMNSKAAESALGAQSNTADRVSSAIQRLLIYAKTIGLYDFLCMSILAYMIARWLVLIQKALLFHIAYDFNESTTKERTSSLRTIFKVIEELRNAYCPQRATLADFKYDKAAFYQALLKNADEIGEFVYASVKSTSAPPDAEFLVKEHFKAILSEENVNVLFSVIDADNSGKITLDELQRGIFFVYQERINIEKTLRDNDEIVSRLDELMILLTRCLIIFSTCMAFRFDLFWSSVVGLGSTLFTGFAIKDTAKDISKSIIFLFAYHPFDIGDKVIIDDVKYTIVKIGFLTTTARGPKNATIYMKNSKLCDKIIRNLRRSADQSESVAIALYAETSQELLDKLEAERDSLEFSTAPVDCNFDSRLNYITMTGNANPYNVIGKMFHEIDEKDEIDRHFGFTSYTEGPSRTGWLVNMHPTVVPDPDWAGGRSAVDLYFIEEDGSYFRATLVAQMYMFVVCKDGHLSEVEDFLKKKFDILIESIQVVTKEDMDLPNHLSGIKRQVLKLSFRNSNDLTAVKKVIHPIITKNNSQQKTESVYGHLHASNAISKDINYADYMIDLREHDIPVHLRLAIDYKIRVGLWYSIVPKGNSVEVTCLTGKHVRPDPVVLAFDIETTKQPLKFPDSAIDQVMMISYMIDGQGYLITNREIVAENIEDFEYSPKAEFPGQFHVFNEPNEEHLLVKFFEHIQEVRPTIFVTYNGDFFDWPFIEKRASMYELDMKKIIGFSQDNQDEYKSTYAAHMDAFKWVKRDSYLPAGSHGLKAVTKAKLGYDPVELDPEIMVEYAQSKSQLLASYSASDSVATYFLYQKYVHPFIFSLCNIIPLNPDEVLRKGSGTLCETLLMAEAFSANILMPNKTLSNFKKFHKGHLLESETYVGGHVEALESGVFRSDIPSNFRIVRSAVQQLIDDLDSSLNFFLQVECKISPSQVSNYQDLKEKITAKLVELRDTQQKSFKPLIFHLDVAAMYPNIILTNRLQPHALVTEATCAACDFNVPGKTCQRKLEWNWRGEYYAAKKNEYRMIINQLEGEKFKSTYGREMSFNELMQSEQNALIEKRLSSYCRKVYKKIHESEIVTREDIVCQKENTFYIDTVKSFRDRRYEYKGLHKVWKGKLEKALADGDSVLIDECKKMNILYDSLQLAHKCIMNSFYGYVMRKGARWFSMEMAGIICEIGSSIIQMARKLVEQVGRPLELDTDGIWCIFPAIFPDKFEFQLVNGKKLQMSFMCTMLNNLVHSKFTNHQYHILTNSATREYKQMSENSIFFEIDGPYHAMILPASTEENKLLKKRYAVLNYDSSVAELKGFEIKRRGELKLIKIFQSYIFKTFLDGDNLEESYKSASKVCNYWLDILYSKGEHLATSELVDLISENRSMSKSLDDYGEQKSTSISTARRLAEFLGDEMIKDKGLSCRFIITAKPTGDPVASRAVPVAIFSAEQHVKEFYLKKWLKDSQLSNFDIRNLLDWSYYLERFESVIQKLVTIPAAMQNIFNPVPRVKQPNWVMRRFGNNSDLSSIRQTKISDIFSVCDKSQIIDSVQPIIPPAAQKPVVNFPILLHSNYRKFIQESKSRWSSLRKNLATLSLSSPNHNSIANFNSLMLTEPWFILAISECKTIENGIFKFWVYQRRGIFQVNVNIPRKFYINSRIPDILPNLQEVFLKLPRSYRRFFLYAYAVDEAEFVDNVNLEAFKTNPDIDSIYESCLSLDTRSIIHLGSFCKPFKQSQSLSSSAYQWQYDDFNALNISDNFSVYSKYPPIFDLFDFGFLFEIGDPQLNHRFLAFIHKRKCLICLVDPSASKNVPSIQSLINWNSSLFDFTSMESQVLSFKSIQAALKATQKFINDSKKDSLKNILVLYQFQNSDLDTRFLDGFLSSPIDNLERVCHESFCIKDCHLPSLDWQRYALKKFTESLSLIDNYVIEMERLARYSNIPFINLISHANPYSFIIDITFARSLVDNSHLLWFHSGYGIDLGGREDDWSINNISEHTNDIYFCRSDFYRSVCFEIDISNLYLNTLLASSQINELENCSVTESIDNDNFHVKKLIQRRNESINLTVNNVQAKFNNMLNISLSDNEYSKSAFHLLKSMLSNWYKEAVMEEDAVSFKLLRTFDSWFVNPQSSLYDSVLVEKVKSLAKKVILQLISHVESNGGQVVFGSCDKIVIACRKTDAESAKEWVDYLLKTLRENELFLWLNMNVNHTFESLFWVDSSNYFGKIFSTEESPFNASFSLFNQYDKSEIKKICINLVGEYYSRFNATGFNSDENSVLEMDLAKFSGKCFDFVQQMMKVHGTSVAVDAVKKLLAFLMADSQYADFVMKLRRNCFLLLGVGEFSETSRLADWENQRILIDDFICPECQFVSFLIVAAYEPVRCTHCNISCQSATHRVQSIFELFLIKHVNFLLNDFFVQDFSCLRCKKVKVGSMQKMCKCAGNYGNTLKSRETLVNELKIFEHVSELHQFTLLKRCISALKISI